MKYWFLIFGLLVVACSKSENNEVKNCPPLWGITSKLAVMMTRGQSSEVRFLDLETGNWLPKVVPIYFDAVFKKGSKQNNVVVLNRMGRDTFQQVFLDQSADVHFSLGGGNVQDLVWVNEDEFWTSYYTHSKIRRWNLKGKDRGLAVEFNEVTDSDGSGEPFSMIRYDGKLFVLFQNLVNYMPVKHASLGLWDGRAKEVFELAGSNPIASLKNFGEFLYVAFAGKTETLGKDYLDGSFGRLDPNRLREGTHRSWQSLITEKELNADLIDFEILNEQDFIFLLGSKKTQVLLWNKGEVKPLLKSEGYAFRKILVDNNKKWLIVADAEPTKPALHFWRLDAVQEHGVCELNTMPPVDLFILD